MANVIGFDPVAWGIDGGRHNAELMRVETYAKTSGEQGIVSLDDCKVHQLSTPGSQIAIDPGAVLVRNGHPNVRNQTYVANARSETRLDVTPTTSAGPRSDLVILRIEDPAYGWPRPSAELAPTYQYVRPFIIQNVPANTTSFDQLNEDYAAYALARLDIPSSTSTITDNMIKNLREVALPRTRRVVRGVNNQDVYTLYWDDTAWHDWPSYANWNIPTPRWATHMVFTLGLGGIVPLYADPTLGYLRLNIGAGKILGDSVEWRIDSAGGPPQTILNADEYAIPANVRGTTQPFKLEARKVSGTSDLRWIPASSLSLDITFEERAS